MSYQSAYFPNPQGFIQQQSPVRNLPNQFTPQQQQFQFQVLQQCKMYFLKQGNSPMPIQFSQAYPIQQQSPQAFSQSSSYDIQKQFFMKVPQFSPIQVKPQYVTIQEPPKQKIQEIHNIEYVPVIHEVHHVERPVQVIKVDQIEEPWRQKVIKLERQLLELELLIRRGNKPEVVAIGDDDPEVQRLNKQILAAENELRDKDDLINEIMGNEQHLANQLDDANSDIIQKEIDRDQNMLDDIKNKFSKLNDVYVDQHKKLQLQRAELESFQNRKAVVLTSNTQTRQSRLAQSSVQRQ